MKKNLYFIRTASFIAVTLIITFVLTLALSARYNVDASSIGNDLVYEINQAALIIDKDTERNINLPFSSKLPDKNATIKLTYRMPDEIYPDYKLSIESTYCDVTAEFEGQIIYTQKTNGKFPLGRICNYIPLTNEMSGKNITVTYKSYKSTFIAPSCCVGNGGSIFVCSLKNNFLAVIISVLSLFLALIYIIIGIIFYVRRHKKMALTIHYGILLVVAFGWGITELEPAIFLNNNNSLLYFVSFGLYMLIPVTVIPIIQSYIGKKSIALRFLGFVFLVNEVISFILHFAGIIPLYNSIIITYILIAVLAVVMILNFIDSVKKYGWKQLCLPFIAFSWLCIFSAVSIVLYLYSSNSSRHLAFINLSVCSSFLIVDSLINIYNSLNADAMTEYYHRLSFTDNLTGVFNRNAYEKRLKDITENEIFTESIGFVIIDIDNFKKLNDGYGHVVGDEVLAFIADCVKENFADIGDCYRIGGDEFAVFIHDTEKELLENKIEKLKREIKSVSNHISVSCGYAHLKTKNEVIGYARIIEIIKNADTKMYSEKRSEEIYAEQL